MRAIYEVVLKKPFLYINSLTNACDSKLHVGRSYEEVVCMTDVVCDSCQTNMYQLQQLLNRWIFVKDNVWKVYLNDQAVNDFSSPKVLPEIHIVKAISSRYLSSLNHVSNGSRCSCWTSALSGTQTAFYCHYFESCRWFLLHIVLFQVLCNNVFVAFLLDFSFSMQKLK